MPPDTVTSDQPADAESWATLKRFLPYLWPKDNPALRKRIAVAMVLVIAAKATLLALPFAYKSAVDSMTGPANEAAMVAMALVLAYGLGRFAGTAFDNLRNIVFERVGQEATRNLAEDVFHRLHRLSLRFHLSRRTGEVTKVIERGTKSIDSMLYFLLFNIAPTIIELIAVGVIFYLNFGWGLVTATAIAVVLYIIVTRQMTEWRTKLRREMNDLDGQALSRAVDSLLNYETVKYFGAEGREEARYAKSAHAYSEAAIRSDASLGWLNITQAFITNALMAGAMAYTVWGWSRGELTVGDLVFVNTYLMQLFRPLDLLGWVYRTIRQGLVDMAQMFALIDTQVEVEDAPGAPALVVRRPSITFDHVHFGYEPERTILHGLTFEVPAGSNVAIVGPSGAGKSTRSRVCCSASTIRSADAFSSTGRISRRSGRIRCARISASSRRTAWLFNDTIGYNIAYGREDANEQDIASAAKAASIMPFIERLPAGFETEVGERGLKLSGGEKQRVAIARTLVKDPPILLLDEATSALDSRTEQDILRTLKEVSATRTTLAIAHRLSTIADADRILVLDQGRLVESGSHTDLLRDDGLYAEMWARQQTEETAEATAP